MSLHSWLHSIAETARQGRRHGRPRSSEKQAGAGLVHPGAASVRLAGAGRPLEADAREAMERRFGQDLSGVRVHTEPAAAESAQSIGARAYSAGEDIVFGPGKYAPESDSGRRLLAHELAHVVQQREGTPATDPEGRARAAADQAVGVAPLQAGSPGSAAPGVYADEESGAEPAAKFPLLNPPSLKLTPLDLSIVLETLDGFVLNHAELTAKHRSAIPGLKDRIAAWLRTFPLGAVRLTGHTDATGGEELNDRLGQQRADAVRDALVAAGIQDFYIRTRSAGKRELKVATKLADSQNRRVEVRFEPKLPPPLPPRISLPSPRTRFVLTRRDLERILERGDLTPEQRDLARILKEIEPPPPNSPNVLEDLAGEVKKYTELHKGDWVIKPDYETIFKGIRELLGL